MLSKVKYKDMFEPDRQFQWMQADTQLLTLPELVDPAALLVAVEAYLCPFPALFAERDPLELYWAASTTEI